MLDQCIIAVPGDRVAVNPAVLTDPQFTLEGGLPCESRIRESSKKKGINDQSGRFYSAIDVFSDRTLRVLTRSRDSRSPNIDEQYVYKIEINPRKITWGHNGRTLLESKQVAFALLVAYNALQELLEDYTQADELIPGMSDSSEAFWQRLEVALDVEDPGLKLLKQLHLMRSPHIRRDRVVYEHTVCLNGTNLEIKGYNKIEQMRKRHSRNAATFEFSAPEITRLEVVLSDKAPTFLREFDPKQRPVMKMFGSKQVITSFNYEQLVAVHRHCFAGLRAVFLPDVSDSPSSNRKFAAMIAHMTAEFDLPLNRVMEIYRETRGAGKVDATRDFRRELESFIESSSELRADEVLSDAAYAKPPYADVVRFEDASRYADYHENDLFGPTSRKLGELYGAWRPDEKFKPRTSPRDFW